MNLEQLPKAHLSETLKRFKVLNEKELNKKYDLESTSNSPEKLQYVQPSQIMKVLEYKDVPTSVLFNDPRGLERTIGSNDLLPINYFLNAIKRGKSVARVTLFSIGGQELGYGTGFMITNNLFMTNNHVFESSNLAANALVEFNYEIDENRTPKSSVIFRTDTNKFFYTSVELDFSIVAVEENSIDGASKVFDFGFLPMIGKTGKIAVGGAVSIIQHPRGNRKSVALRNNRVTIIEGNFIQYETDTEPGSSGSPVFNDDWELVGIHHSGVPKTDENGNWLTKKGLIANNSTPEEDIDWIANEGIRVSSIINNLKANVNTQQRILLNEVFANNPDANAPSPPNNDNSNTGNAYYNKNSDITERDKYYKEIDFSGSGLFDTLSILLNKTHKNILEYSPSKFLYPDVDLHPDGKIRSIYSNKVYTLQEFLRLDEMIDVQRKARFTELAQNNNLMLLEDLKNELDSLESQLPYNCEHVVPQSWFSKQNPMKGDLHHLFACESGCNSFRSNIPYFDFPDYKPEELAEAEAIRQMCGNRENDKFEPQANKAIVARATLYFLLRYPRNISDNYTKERLITLTKWHNTALPNEYEKHRNALIFKKQGNRNPLIDFPELINKVDFNKGL